MDCLEISLNGKPNTGGLCGTMSWNRLERLLRKNGEVSKDEVITHISATTSGIQFIVERC